MLRKALFLVMTMLTVPSLASAYNYWSVSASTSPAIPGAVTAPAGAGYATSGSSTNITSAAITSADFSVAATSGNYTLSYVLVDGVKSTPVAANTYRVNKGTKINHTLSAVYATQKYTISTSKSGNGYIDPSVTVAAGSSKTITMTPGAGYKIGSVAAGAAVLSAGDGVSYAAYTFSNIQANQSISANFVAVPAVDAKITTPAQTVGTGAALVIDGSNSTSSVAAAYDWSVSPAGATVTPSVDGKIASFSASAAGTYTVSLQLSAAGASSDSASVVITVVPQAVLDSTQCTVCHNDRSPEVVAAWSAGTHGTQSASCQSCHNAGHGAVSGSVSYASATPAAIAEPGQSTPGVAVAAGYIGANACQACHAEQFAGWSKTIHNKPLKTIAGLGDSIFVNDSNNNGQNDFKDNLNFATAGATLVNKLGASYANPWASKGANAPKLSYESSKYYITIGNVKYEIFRTQGGNGKWKQRYHTKIGNAYYVFNVQYNEINGQYEEYNGGNWYNGANPWITDGTSNTDPATIAQVSRLLLAANVNGGITGTAAKGPSTASWDNRCAACHQAGVAIEYKAVDGSNMEVVASSADLNVGCEACHGPGAAHASAPTKSNIKQPGEWATNLGEENYYRANEVCGQCHSRVEGAAHFPGLYAGIEAPSELDATGYKAISYNVGEKVLHFMELIIPGVFNKVNGTSGNNGKIAYDDIPATATNAMLDFGAADKHHQQWHDMELGKHGAIQQMNLNQGLTCFSCHDAHNPNSGNIKASIKVGGVVVPTKSDDNTLCLACHAGFGDFAAASVTDVATAPTGDAVKNAVYNHMTVKGAAGKGCVGSTEEGWKSKYLQSVQKNGSTATFGRAVYKVGECISCHMPFTAKSGIRVSSNANGRAQGDIRNHSMKALWPKLSGNGLTSATVVTACSACHAVPAN